MAEPAVKITCCQNWSECDCYDPNARAIKNCHGNTVELVHSLGSLKWRGGLITQWKTYLAMGTPCMPAQNQPVLHSEVT